MPLPMDADFTLMERAFELLVQKAAGNGLALARLAERALLNGDQNRAITLAREAQQLRPDDPEIQFAVRFILSRAIPGWHVDLVKDQRRNDAFAAAIERHVKPGVRVLDVGAGTGLLAMMAARAGSEAVFSCELNLAMADVASEIVRANGLEDRITILPKNSRDIDPVADMGGPADLVVAEILGADVVGEQVLPAMRDVVARLAKPGARLIPQSGEIRTALAWWDGLDRLGMGIVNGFDLSAFNRLLRPCFGLNLADAALHLRGPAQSLFAFDFAQADHGSDRTEIPLQSDGGQVNGVAQWIRLKMDETADYENRPGPGATSSWSCKFYPLPNPVETSAGQRLRIGATYRGNRLKVWGLPAGSRD